MRKRRKQSRNTVRPKGKEEKKGNDWKEWLKKIFNVGTKVLPIILSMLNKHGSVSFRGRNVSLPVGVPLAATAGYPQTLMPRFTGKRGGTVFNLSGTDYVGPVTFTAATEVGDVLMEIAINPAAFPSTRMHNFSVNFEKYTILTIIFVYEPCCAATQAGSLIGFCDHDVDAYFTTEGGVDNLRLAAAHYGEKATQLWQPCGWSLQATDERPRQLYYCDLYGKEERLTTQGKFVLMAAGDSGVSGDTIMGNIYVHYDVDFEVPQLENPGAGTGSYLRSTMAGNTITAPFGTAVEPEEVVTADGRVMNHTARYAYQVGGGDGMFGLDVGLYTVAFYIQGTGLGALTINVSDTADDVEIIEEHFVGGATHASGYMIINFVQSGIGSTGGLHLYWFHPEVAAAATWVGAEMAIVRMPQLHEIVVEAGVFERMIKKKIEELEKELKVEMGYDEERQLALERKIDWIVRQLHGPPNDLGRTDPY